MPIVTAVIVVLAIAAFGTYKLLNRPRAFNLQDMQITKLTDSGNAADVGISPDGREIVYVLVNGEKQSLWVRNVATKSDVQVLAPASIVFAGVNFSRDGDYIYFERADNGTDAADLYVMPVLGGTPRQLVRNVNTSISFSPDGKQFSFLRGGASSGRVQVCIANADGTGERLLVALPPGPFYAGTAWSPDGKTIVASSVQFGKQIKWVLSAVRVDDGRVSDLYSSSEDVGKPVWMPDGDSLLVPMGPVTGNWRQLWIISYPGGERRRFTNDLADYGTSIDLTRDGRTLVAIQETRISHIWIAPQGQAAQAKQISFRRNRRPACVYLSARKTPGSCGKHRFGSDEFGRQPKSSVGCGRQKRWVFLALRRPICRVRFLTGLPGASVACRSRRLEPHEAYGRRSISRLLARWEMACVLECPWNEVFPLSDRRRHAGRNSRRASEWRPYA